MGQKVNPVSLRFTFDKKWKSRWFTSKKEYARLLLEDIIIREKILNKLGPVAAIGSVEIERKKGEVTVFIHTARPGVIIGRSGKGIEQLQNFLQKGISDKIKLEVIEIKTPELSAALTALNIAVQISKRIHYKRAIKFAIDKVVQAGAKGVKVAVSGRLGGAEIARRETFSSGSIPLGRLRADIDFAKVDALTTYGVIGVKVWIYKGERGISNKEG